MSTADAVAGQSTGRQMTGAEILVHMLRSYGVNTVFGVPGDTNVPLYAAFQQNQEAIRHIMARDERSAGFMADAYARLTHRPAVIEVPSGAGALYAMPPIAEAQQSSIPILVITCDTPLSMEGRGVITELRCDRLFEPITKLSYLVKSAQKIPETIRRAFRALTSGRPGAVHLAIPEDILAAEIDVDCASLHIEEACRVYPAHRPEVERAALQALLDNIRAAQRPLLILGGGVNVSNAGAVATRIAEKLGMPVVTTITGQSAIPDIHPLSIGVIGDNGFHPHAMTALNEADLLIYVGSKIGSVVTIGWSFPRKAGQKTIQIDIDPEVLGNNTANIQSLCGDIRAILEGLERELSDTAPKATSWVTSLNAARQTFWDEVQSETPSAADPIRPLQVVQALNDLLPPRTVIVADAGTPTPNLTRYLRLSGDGSRLIIPRAYGGLGYAIPAVVGIWAANPRVKPIGIFGDGSFNMSCGELETLRRLNVPALLMHFNNACFGWIKALQRSHGHNQTFSVDFSADNIAKIAEAFGLKAWHVRRPDELEPALAAGLDCDGPALIDIVVESIADISPPVFSWLKRAGRDPLALSVGARVRVDRQA